MTDATETTATATTPAVTVTATTLKPGWRTSEFWMNKAALLLSALFLCDVIPTSGMWMKLAGVAACILISQGYTVSRTMLKAGAMLLVLAFMPHLTGCSWLKSEGKATAHDVVDCTTSEAKSLSKQFGPTIDDVLVTATNGDGSIDKARVKSAIKGFATDTARCVFADAVARALAPKAADPNAPKSSPLDADPAALHELLAELGGGKSYKTDWGAL